MLISELKVVVYGSYKTGLAMPWSDIDLGLQLVRGNYFPDDVLSHVSKIMGKAQYRGKMQKNRAFSKKPF